MFSQASVILSTIGLMDTWSLLTLDGYSVTAHSCYGAVGTHHPGMLSCCCLLIVRKISTEKNNES